jgi:hypothetical protein
MVFRKNRVEKMERERGTKEFSAPLCEDANKFF